MAESDTDVLRRHNFYVFPIENRYYGIDIGAIREVIEIQSADEITPVPHSQPSILGYVNIRGAVQQVVSLKRLLGDIDVCANDGGMIICCKETVAFGTGIYFDQPGEIIPVDEKEIDRWDSSKKNEGFQSGNSRTSFMACGACRLQRGIVTILDPRKIYDIAGQFEC